MSGLSADDVWCWCNAASLTMPHGPSECSSPAALSDEDTAALDAVLMREDWQSHQLLTVVKAIAARHVNAALTEAAEAIAGDEVMYGSGNYLAALNRCEQIVRARTTT